MQEGFIEELLIQREKGYPFEKVLSMELCKDRGIVGDWHSLSDEKQIALISLKVKDWMKEQAVKGLCFSRFQENILLNSLEFSELKQGVVLKTEYAKIEVILYTKRCFSECSLVKDALPCELREGIRFAKVIQSGSVHIGDRIWIDSHFL